MGWASGYIEQLKTESQVSFRPKGSSMSGRIDSGQLVTVQAVTPDNLKAVKSGDIVLCTVGSAHYLHVVKGIRKSGETPISFLIGNNKGGTNGWTPAAKIHGLFVRVDP